jgi:type IV pilus assembly protein PilN
MIRINLLGEKVDRSATYALQLVGFVAGVVLLLGIGFFVRDGIATRVADLTAEKARLDKELARLEIETKKVEELEKKRKVLSEKLQTIAILKTKKRGPVHILDDMNKAIPERSWLVEAKQKDGMVEIRGISLDNQTVSVFMENLKTYPFFGDVDLVVANEFVKDGVKLREFQVLVKLKNPIQALAKDPKIAGAPAAPAAAEKNEKVEGA